MDLKKTRGAPRTWLMGLLITFLLTTTALIPGVAAQPKPPQWGSDYMQRSSDCTGRADPINLMFYKAGYRALSKVEQNLGWTRIEGDTMYVRDHSQCFPSAQRRGFQQRKSEPFNCRVLAGVYVCDKKHIRLWDGLAPDGAWGYYTGGGTHRDIGVPYMGWVCHYGGNFDDMREEVRAAFQSLGYFTWTADWMNRAPVSQPCGAPDTQSVDGKVAFVELPAPLPTMFKAPARANLWICAGYSCLGPGEGSLNLQQQVSGVTTFDWNHDDQFDGVGRYQYDVIFDNTKVGVTSQDSGLLGSTGRSVSCSSSAVSGGRRFWCQSQGPASQPGPLGANTDGSSGRLATTWVTPHPNLADPQNPRGNPPFRPTKNNYLQVALNDENCRLNDIFGNAVPGSLSSGLLPYCYDATISVRILEGDVNLDCEVNVRDQQAIGNRYASRYGLYLYAVWYDLEPRSPDWDIDIKDLQFVWGRDQSTCQRPIPIQPPE